MWGSTYSSSICVNSGPLCNGSGRWRSFVSEIQTLFPFYFVRHSLHRVAVKLGEHNLETEIDCEADQCADPPQVIYPTSITVPTEYNGLQLRHDVALIRLSEPANMTRYVSPVCLPSGDLATKNLLGDIVEVGERKVDPSLVEKIYCRLLVGAGSTLIFRRHRQRSRS